MAQGGTSIIYNIDGDWPALGCSLGSGKLVRVNNLMVAMFVDADGTRHLAARTVQETYITGPGLNGDTCTTCTGLRLHYRQLNLQSCSSTALTVAWIRA
jgi:hypothetical protein